jgi:hypothetical protein
MVFVFPTVLMVLCTDKRPSPWMIDSFLACGVSQTGQVVLMVAIVIP